MIKAVLQRCCHMRPLREKIHFAEKVIIKKAVRKKAYCFNKGKRRRLSAADRIRDGIAACCVHYSVHIRSPLCVDSAIILPEKSVVKPPICRMPRFSEK